MKNQLQVFSNTEFGELGVIEIGGKPYFPATRCAEILGYKNPQEAIRDHCKGVSETLAPTTGGVQSIRIIPEGDLYRLIVRSRLPEAERFERWVFDDVLPSVRKHGLYAIDELLENPEVAIKILQELKTEREKKKELEKKVRAQEMQLKEMKQKSDYCDLILSCENAVPITVIAKDYGKTGRWMNMKLHDLGVQYRIGETWVLYQKHAGNRYTRTHTYLIEDEIKLNRSVIHTYWTQEGRLFLYKSLKKRGILPLCEQEYVQEEDRFE